MFAWPRRSQKSKSPVVNRSRSMGACCRLYRPRVEELESRCLPSANVALTMGTGVQQNPSIAADPSNPNHLVVAFMDYSLLSTGYAGIGTVVSTDGGATWSAESSVPLPANFNQGAATPVVRFDGQGHVFLSFMAATFLDSMGNPAPLAPLTSPDATNGRAQGFQANNGVFVARSSDGGLTWNQPVAVVSNLYGGTNQVPFDIQPDLGIDTFARLPDGQTNPNYGHFYEVWARFYPAGQFPGQTNSSSGGSLIMVARSTDGGLTWQPPTAIIDPFDSGMGPPPGFGAVAGPHPAIGPSGDIYVSFFALGGYAVYASTAADDGTQFAMTNGQPFGTNSVNIAGVPGFTNGEAGVPPRTYTVSEIAADPTRPGTVYTTDMNTPIDAAGNQITDAFGNATDPADIVFSRTTDSGQTWNPQVQFAGQTQPGSVLNDDNGGQLATALPSDVNAGQLFPRFATDAQGDLTAIWYDQRRDPAKKEFDVFGTVSTDGGKTFSADFRLTAVTFDPSAGAFTDATGQTDDYLGDFIGLALGGGKGYAVWTDTRNGNQDIYFTSFTLSPAPAPLNDRFGPNNTAATASDLGTVVHTYEPKLAVPANDQEWFRVTTFATGNLYVTATPEAPNTSPPLLELYDATGNTPPLASSTLSSDGSSEQIVYPSGAGVTYLIRILPGAGVLPGEPAGYALDVKSLTAADLGTQVYGALPNTLSSGDRDAYLLTTAAPGSLQVTLTPGPGFLGNVTLEVLDPITRQVLASATGSPVQTASLAVNQGQTVVLHVVSNAGGSGPFTLQFTNLDQYQTPPPLNSNLLFPAGNGPSAEAVADVNGDNFPDVVVSDTGANVVSVLLNNGDGTFEAPRQYAVGAFTPLNEPSRGRPVAVADVNGDGIPDILVANDASGDISVLLGNGGGTFAPQRRFVAGISPQAMTVRDFNGDGLPDIVALETDPSGGKVAVLLGNGDGTFQPPQVFDIPLSASVPVTPAIQLAVLQTGGPVDLLLGDEADFTTYIYTCASLENGTGPVTTIPLAAAAFAVGDLNQDNIPDVIALDPYNNGLNYALGNGDGTFQAPPPGDTFAGQSPLGVAIVQPDGSPLLGPKSSLPELLVAASGYSQPASIGPSQVLLFPNLGNVGGQFAGFNSPPGIQLDAHPTHPTDIATADVNNDGFQDLVVVEADGVRVIYGQPPTFADNSDSATPRKLGTVVHVVEPTQTIVPGHEVAYFTLKAPTEVVPGAGDEVLDFSGLFQATAGAGISMEVLEGGTNGTVIGSGERFRVQVPQGTPLTLLVFGLPGAGGTLGTGAYTLDIDALPQVVGVEAQNFLPGVGVDPGGPTTSLVITLQGDRLDASTAENPANYVVTWLGPDGVAGTTDDQVIPINGNVAGTQPVVYDPSNNIAGGLVFPTAVRQAVTLTFADPLPAGSYQVDLSPAIQTAAFNPNEQLSPQLGFTGHPVVFLSGGQIVEGSQVTAANLVLPPSPLGSFSNFATGTPFLTQFHDDLGTLLDAQLNGQIDSPALAAAITTAINNDILDRLNPALGPEGQRPIGVLVIWLDPMSVAVTDPQLKQASYKLGASSFQNSISNLYVNVSFNIEVMLRPLFADDGGLYDMKVSDVPAAARGGVVILGFANGVTTLADGVLSLTGDLRAGLRQFEIPITIGSTPPAPAAAAGAGLTNTAPGLASGPPAAPTDSSPGTPPGVNPLLAAALLQTYLSRTSDSLLGDANPLTTTGPFLADLLAGLRSVASGSMAVDPGGGSGDAPVDPPPTKDPPDDRTPAPPNKEGAPKEDGAIDRMGRELLAGPGLPERIEGQPLPVPDSFWQAEATDRTARYWEPDRSALTAIANRAPITELLQETYRLRSPAERNLEPCFTEHPPQGDQALFNLMAVALLMSGASEASHRKNASSRRVRLPALHE